MRIGGYKVSSKDIGTVAGATIGGGVGGPIGAAIGAKVGGQIGQKTTGDLKTPQAPGAPRPADNWWKVDRPESRFQFTDSNGNLKNNFKMTAASINAPQSRLGEIDKRLSGVNDVGFLPSFGGVGAAAGLGLLSARALSNDLSNPAKARMGLIDQQRRAGIDAMNQNVAGATAGGMSNLAASGGMDSGARQRLQSDAIKSRMSGVAGAYNAANQQKSQVGIQDLTNQYELQRSLPGMYMDFGRQEMDAQKFNAGLGMDKINAYARQGNLEDDRRMLADRFNATNNMTAQQYNIDNAMNDKRADDAFAMDKWQTGNAAQAGQFTADAQNYYAKQQADRGLLGNKGGLLGTGIQIF